MTKRLYYSDPYIKETTARVVDVKNLGNGLVEVLLDRTIFYPEGGGQPSDRGLIEGDGFTIEVTKVKEREEIWHEGVIAGRLPERGEKVTLKIDWDWRYENMKNHTGQHILSAVLKELYDLDTTGFQIFEHYNKIEVNGGLDWEMITKAEIEANRIVSEGIPVTIEEFKYLPDDLVKTLRKHVSKVTDRVRIVSIGNVDKTPCGGTHVGNTSEIGTIKILRFYKKSKNLWRIEFVAGNRALKTLNELLEDYWKALDEMPNKNRPLFERVGELKAEMDSLEGRLDELRRELWRWKKLALIDKAEEVGHYNVISLVEKWPMKDAQAFAVNFVEENPGLILLLASEDYVLFARNEEVDVSMRDLLSKVIEEFGGKGGGTDNLARGRIEAEPEDVLDVAREILREIIGA
ncbi:DHHA1 domain-containing protein [Thermococcus sp. 21S7]|uniref:alanyl-tRNA editing protein n=1 Tax=Thermococcus sp. 21S7 TaxID=1638221 RepID=UPI001438C0CD|nr:DHHA1 domain-containing protein [Thermococcus sp. 21S7]NJE62487.1 alanyl-tRNA editing protein AlaX [Thermococcus sp. 21S7]